MTVLVSHSKYYVAVVTAIALLTSCAGGSSTPTTPLASQQNQSHTGKHATSCPCLYVTNWLGDSVTLYAAGATGAAKPIQYIHGPRTGLSDPAGIAVDSSGNMYVANVASSSVTEYAAGANGNARPIRTIGGSNTGLLLPTGVALNPVNGDIYVAEGSTAPSNLGFVIVYGADANGNVAPIGAIGGANTGLANPWGVVLDASGNVFVANLGGGSAHSSSVTVYAAGSVGNVAPLRTICGARTKLDGPYQLVLDSSSNIHVANGPYNGDINSLPVYAAGANGNVAPIQTIMGKRTKLDSPEGIALDGNGNTYAANTQSDTVTIYPASATGNVKPIAMIKGKRTDLDAPEGIAIR